MLKQRKTSFIDIKKNKKLLFQAIYSLKNVHSFHISFRFFSYSNLVLVF